jgi:hypothetical protein
MHPDTDASTSPPFEPAISSLLLLLLLLYAFVKLSLCAGSGESRSRKEEFTREHTQTHATAVAAHRSSTTITTTHRENTSHSALVSCAFILKIVATETGVEFYDESPSFFLQCFDETLLASKQRERKK